MPTEKEKWLKFHDGQYQFKVPFMLYADFESILKPVDERYRGGADNNCNLKYKIPDNIPIVFTA